MPRCRLRSEALGAQLKRKDVRPTSEVHLSKRLTELESLHGACVAAIPSLTAENVDQRLFTLTMAYSSLIELGGSVALLARQSHWTAVPSVVRTMLETYVDLCNLASDTEYLEFMNARESRDARALLSAIGNGGSALTQSLAGQIDLDDVQMQLLMDETESSSKRALSAKDRFSRAGLYDAYEIVYRLLSSDAHSNLSALRGRHAEPRGDGLGLTLHSERDESQMAFMLGLSKEMLGQGAVMVYGALEADMPAGLSACFKS